MTAAAVPSAPTVSVALCTRNGARFIEEQLESVLAQSSPPFEIVLSDDASTDDTVHLARQTVATFERKDASPPVELRVIENPSPLGVTLNFRQAMLATSGELIALCDQDDRWHPQRLRRVAAEFTSRPNLLLLHGNAWLVDEKGTNSGHTLFTALGVTAQERASVRSGRAFETYLRRNLVTGATTVVRRSLLEVASAFPREWVHDEWLGIVAAAVGEVDLLDEPLLDYRQHGANEIGARKLSLVGKVGRMLEPRATRNARLARNAGILVEELCELGARVPEAKLLRARGKLDYEIVRSQLPSARFRRLLPVVKQVRAGNYSRYGRGVPDAVRDLLQPAR